MKNSSMGVNCMLEVSLVRCDDVPSVSRKRERRYPFHRRYCCGRGRGPLEDRKKLLACPVACDAPEGGLLLNSSCAQKRCPQRTQKH